MTLCAVLLAMSVMASLAGGLVLLTSTESALVAQHRRNLSAFYAAEAALEHVLADVRVSGSWVGTLTPFAAGAERPWQTPGLPISSREGQEWHQYLGGWLPTVVPVAGPSEIYVEVWTSPDAGAPGGDGLAVQAAATSRAGDRRVLQAVVVRTEEGLRRTSWTELR